MIVSVLLRENRVNHRVLGRTGLKVSEIGLGALEVGRPWGIRSDSDPGLPPSESAAHEFLNSTLDSGVNLIDTAAAYWASEERIGRFLSQRRDEYVLATKWGEWCDENGSVYDYTPAAMSSFLEKSLLNLQTDVIDLYQIHSGPLDVIRSDDVIAAMVTAKEQGKIRYTGVSCAAREAVAAIESGHFDAIQISYSLLDRTMEEQVLPLARQHNVGVIVKDGLAAGRLTSKIDRLGEDHADIKRKVSRLRDLAREWGMSLPEMSLRFVLSNQSVSSVIAGTRSSAHLQENLKAADGLGLSSEQLQAACSVT